MAPSIPLVAALLRLADADLDEQSMLQMPAVEKAVEIDTSDCACPGYYEEQCTENAFQGCVWTSENLGRHSLGWTDEGHSDSPWCQCDPDFVPTLPLHTNGSPPAPVPPAPVPPAPVPPAPSNTQAPAAVCPAGWEQKGEAGADIGGCGLQACGERYDITSEAACAARCDENDACAGFSYAPMNGDRNHPGVTACTIYDSDAPTGTWTGTEGIATQVMCGRAVTAKNCWEHLQHDPAAQDGIYTVTNGVSRFDVYCDMANGGWTLVHNVPGSVPQNDYVITAAVGGTVLAGGTYAKLSDADINSITGDDHYFKWTCGGADVRGLYRQEGWTSLRDQGHWEMDRNFDGTSDCTANRPNYIFADYPGNGGVTALTSTMPECRNPEGCDNAIECGSAGHVNYGEGSGQGGCYHTGDGWGADAQVWARGAVVAAVVDEPLAARNCWEHLQNDQAAQNGIYTLTFDDKEVSAYCDMANGGWTLIHNVPADILQNDYVTVDAKPSGFDPATATPTLLGGGSYFKFSDADINSMAGDDHYFKWQCGGADTRGLYRQGGWTSLRDQGGWEMDRNFDGQSDCTANRPNYIFADYPGNGGVTALTSSSPDCHNPAGCNPAADCGSAGHVNYGEGSSRGGCYFTGSGWGTASQIWLRGNA